MSRILDLGSKLSGLPKLVEEYENALEGYEANLEIKGKSLETANREQATLQVYYDQKRLELNTVVKYVEIHINRVRSKLFRKYTEQHSRELSDRVKDKYIDNEPAFLNMKELYLELKETHDKYDSVVEAFRTRGFALSNITKARIASVHDDIL